MALADPQRFAAPPLVSEQGSDLITGIVTMDDTTFVILPSLSSGVSATSRFNCRALLATGSSQSFIHKGSFSQIVPNDATDASYLKSMTARS